MGRDQVSREVNVPCQHATPVANVLWKPLGSRKRSSAVKRSQIIINFNIFHVYYFLPQLPTPRHIPSQDDLKPMKTLDAHTDARSLPQQSGDNI